jgi:hypothetical protein
VNNMSISYKFRNLLNEVWSKIERSTGTEFDFNPLLNGIVIDQPLTLYVETTGDDSNPGTQTAPFKTIQAALESLTDNKRIEAAVTILVGAGNFAGFAVPAGLVIGQLGSITIEGAITVVDSGAATAFSVVDAFFNVTDSTKTWTTDQHVGRFMKWTNNLGTTIIRPIGTNSATQVSLANNNSNFGTGVTAYQIIEQATVISSAVPATVSSSGAAMVFSSIGGSRTVASGFTVKNIKTTTGAGGILCRYGAYATVSECSIGNQITTANGAIMSIANSYLAGGTIASGSCVTVNGASFSNISLSVNQCVLSVGGSGWGISIVGGEATHVWASLCQFRCSGGTAISVIGGLITVPTAGIWGAATAVRAHQQATIMSGNASTLNTACNFTGSGNTLAIECTKGSQVSISSTSTITGSTEISVDGATSTIAAMRALTPKVFPSTPNAYGSYIYE